MDRVCVVVYDSCTFPSPPIRSEMLVPVSTTVEELIDRISITQGYNKEVFEATWRRNVIVSGDERTLTDIGFIANKKEAILIGRRFHNLHG